MTPSAEDVILVLKLARFKIEAGWCQNNFAVYRHGVEHYCPVGALRVSVYGKMYPGEMYPGEKVKTYNQRVFDEQVNHAAVLALAKAVPVDAIPRATESNVRSDPDAATVAMYNDKRGRTKEEILALFDRAMGSL